MSLAKALRSKPITRIESEGQAIATDDVIAVEEPLEIRIGGRSIAVVMRTPGHDRELAAGFLVTEGLVRSRDDVLDLIRCGPTAGAAIAEPRDAGAAAPGAGEPDAGLTVTGSDKSPGPRGTHGSTPPPGPAAKDFERENILEVVLAPGASVDLAKLTRHVFTSSSCGICSKATIEAVRGQFPSIARPRPVSAALIAALPARLASAQAGFAASGGLHASALFRADGTLDVVREDVGRHNALDKVIGHAFFAGRLPLADSILLVSGRVSFELMQKALAGGIPVVAAISAPTTAAVEFAQASGQTLVGFVRPGRMNVYAGTLAG